MEMGRTPGGLTAAEMAGQATLRAAAHRLREYIDTMLSHGNGVLADHDIEHLHQYRVNLRRARSLMDALEPALEPGRWHPLRKRLAVLNRLAGTLRDLDVIGTALPALAERAPSGRKAVRKQLALVHGKTRDEARFALLSFLERPRYRELMADWRAFVTDMEREAPDTVNRAGLPQIAAVTVRVELMYRRARRLGSVAIATRSRADLHETRKAIKRLRYLVDAFAEQLPESLVTTLADQTRALQKSLGTFCDLELERDFVAVALAGQKAKCRPLLARLELDIDAQVGRCLARLADFESPQMWRQVEALTQAPPEIHA